MTQSVVDSINRELSSQNTEFQLLGWKDVSGTVRRPQDAINTLIEQSDFMLCVFRQNWGSPPGGNIYSSGTEEELFLGLLKLADAKSLMRDVCLVFTEYKGERREPEVQNLQDQVVKAKALLFERVENIADYTERVRARLLEWAALSDEKAPQFAHITPSSGRDVIGAFHLRTQGETLASLGVIDHAETRFKEAISIGALSDRLAYAVFLGRQSRIAEALKVVADAKEELVAERDFEIVNLVEVMLTETSLRRREGDLEGAWASLNTALPYLIGSDPHTARLRSRINDELGVLAYKQGLRYLRAGQEHLSEERFTEAQGRLEKAYRERSAICDDHGVAQSEINIGRLEVALGRYESAIGQHSSAIRRLSSTPNGTLANAYLARSQALLAASRQSSHGTHDTKSDTQTYLSSALDDANRALTLNRRLLLRRNEAMVLNVIAQILNEDGNFSGAEEHARECVRINMELGYTAPRKARELAEGVG